MHWLCQTACHTKVYCNSFQNRVFQDLFSYLLNGASTPPSYLKVCTCIFYWNLHIAAMNSIAQQSHQENVMPWTMFNFFPSFPMFIFSLVQIISWIEKNHRLGIRYQQASGQWKQKSFITNLNPRKDSYHPEWWGSPNYSFLQITGLTQDYPLFYLQIENKLEKITKQCWNPYCWVNHYWFWHRKQQASTKQTNKNHDQANFSLAFSFSSLSLFSSYTAMLNRIF